MRSTIALALLLLSRPVGAEQVEYEPVEYEGEGVVQVVGENLVSARRRALSLAQQDAVIKAVAALVSADGPPQSRPSSEPESQVYRRYARYLRRYRVVSEEQLGRQFRVRVASTLDLKLLQRDLNAALGGGATSDPSSARMSISLSVSTHPASSSLVQRLVALVTTRLRGAGLDVDGGPARAGARGKAALLEVTVSVVRADGVRGLELAGARADATTRVNAPPGGAGTSVLAQASARAWEVEQHQEQADLQAAVSALEAALDRLVPQLLRRWPSRGVGGRIVRITGIATHRQYAAVREALAERVPGVRSCRPRLLERGAVEFLVTTAPTLSVAALSSALSRLVLDGFKLERKNAQGGATWLAVVPSP